MKNIEKKFQNSIKDAYKILSVGLGKIKGGTLPPIADCQFCKANCMGCVPGNA